MLTIQNYEKINDTQFNCMGRLWLLVHITERDDFYQLSFMPEVEGVFAIFKSQFVRLYRRINENGFEYDIELTDSKGVRKKIHNQYIKDPKDLLNWISSKILLYVED
jgi:predicted transcriptional regulator